jgi:hypothetical protein
MRRRKGMRRKIVAIMLAVMTVSTAVIGCGDNKTTETESKKVQTSTETSDHDEIKKYIKNADEIVIVKDAKNLDLEKAVNSLVSEEQKAKVESVTVDDSKVDSTKAGTYPLTITVKLKAETTEQNIVSATTDNSAESMDTSTSEKEPDTEADKDAAKDTVKDTVDVIVAEKKDAEDLLNKGSAVIGDDSKVEVKEDKKNASNDGKEEEKKTEDSSKQEVSNKTDSKKEESKKEDTKKNDTKKEPSKQEKTAKNDSKKNEKSNTSTSNKKQETTKPTPSTSTTTKPATNSGSNKDNSNKTETKPVHQHNYVAQTHVVHHEATGHNEQYVIQDAWDEQVTTYEDYAWSCCNVCRADCTADPEEHMYQHAIKYEGGGWHTEYDVRPVTKTVHHDAVYGTRWVQDTAAYDETVVDGYVCSCGARK